MTVTILIKKSATPGSVPSAGSLAVGELAVNYADGRIWTKLANNTVAELTGVGPVGSPTAGSAGPSGVVGPPGNGLKGPVGPRGPTTTVNAS